MGSRRHLLVLLVTTLALTSAVPAQATVRFVSKAGADDNVCTVAPGCASLNYAMNWVSSGDEISIGAGTYDAPDSIFPNVPLDIHGDTAVDRSATKLRGPGSFIAVGSGGAGTHIHHLSFESTGSNFGAGALLAVNAPTLLEDLAISIDNAGNPVGRDAVSADVQLPSSGVVTLKDSTITANSNTSAPTVSAFNGQLVVRNVSISRTSGGSSPALGVIGSGNFPAATIDAKDVTISVDTGACINISPQAGAGSIFDNVTATQDAPGLNDSSNPCLTIDRTSTWQNVTVNAPESHLDVTVPPSGIGASIPAVLVGLNNASASSNVLLKNMTVTTRALGLAVYPVTGLQVRGGHFAGQVGGMEIYGALGVISDALTRGTGANSWGIAVENGTSVRLRNLTAIATGVRQGVIARDNGTDASVKNTIARGTGAGEDVLATSNAALTIFKSNYVDFLADPGATITDAGGRQTGDPLFVNPALADYHVQSGSPVIDAGATDPDLGTTDIDGEARIQRCALPDIGADEFAAACPPPPDTGGGGSGGGGGGGTTPTTTPATTDTPVTAPPTTVPPTTSVPGPVVAISAAAVKVTKTGVANVRIGCPATAEGSCQGTLTLQTAAGVSISAKKILKLGSRSFKLAAGKQAFVGVKLSKQALKLLKKVKRLRVKAIANVRDANGAARITQRLLSLKIR